MNYLWNFEVCVAWIDVKKEFPKQSKMNEKGLHDGHCTHLQQLQYISKMTLSRIMYFISAWWIDECVRRE